MTLVYGMTNESIIAVIIGFILLIIFVIFERKLPFALMPMSLFKNKVRTGAMSSFYIYDGNVILLVYLATNDATFISLHTVTSWYSFSYL